MLLEMFQTSIHYLFNSEHLRAQSISHVVNMTIGVNKPLVDAP